MSSVSRLRKRRIIKTDTEREILVGLIMSDTFCYECMPIIDKKYFKIKYAPILIDWIADYFDQFNKAPQSNIKRIYEIEKEEISEDLSEIIGTFLDRLSSEYANDENFNSAYLLDKTYNYFNRRKIEVLAETLTNCVQAGKINRAEKEIAKFTKVEAAMAGWYNPLDDKEVQMTFESKIENRLFRFPGALGRYVGYFERTFLIGMMGAQKRGKSTWLKQVIDSALWNKLRVAEINIELQKTTTKERMYSMLTNDMIDIGDTPKTSIRFIPIFDCLRNQNNRCDVKGRTNNVVLSTETKEDDKGGYVYKPGLAYRACTYCRDDKSLRKNFIPALWYSEQIANKLSKESALKAIEKARYVFKDNIRSINYPEFSVNLATIEKDLAILEQEGFYPDVITIDYPDILLPEAGTEKNDARSKEDERWKKLKRLAATKKAAVFVVTNANRQSFVHKSIKREDTGEDIRKLGHVDIMMTINQTDIEKMKGYSRIGLAVQRHKDSNMIEQVVVLQDIGTGAPLLDSYMLLRDSPFKEKNKNNNK